MCNLVPSLGPVILIGNKPSNHILKGGQAHFAPFVRLLVTLSFLALTKCKTLCLCHEISRNLTRFPNPV